MIRTADKSLNLGLGDNEGFPGGRGLSHNVQVNYTLKGNVNYHNVK